MSKLNENCLQRFFAGGALHRKAQQCCALLRAFLFLSLMSKLNGFKTKKPWHFVPGFPM
jgi:hypothetical protein